MRKSWRMKWRRKGSTHGCSGILCRLGFPRVGVPVGVPTEFLSSGLSHIGAILNYQIGAFGIAEGF